VSTGDETLEKSATNKLYLLKSTVH